MKLLALVLAAVALTASTAVAATDPKTMVLRLSDLPAGFGLKRGFYADNARAARETAAASLADYNRWGRINGYEAEYAREGIAGIGQVNSAASTYKAAGGARDSLRRSFAQAAKPSPGGLRFKRLSAGGRIGHEVRVYSTTYKSEGLSVTLVTVLWRYGTVRASIYAGGLRGTVDVAEVVRLAKRQQSRVAAALR